MPFFSEDRNELIGSYPVQMWKDDCIFCSRAGNCGAECVEWYPLIDKEN